jgi:hypothetical protein
VQARAAFAEAQAAAREVDTLSLTRERLDEKVTRQMLLYVVAWAGDVFAFLSLLTRRLCFPA